jgi:hypothetical protein
VTVVNPFFLQMELESDPAMTVPRVSHLTRGCIRRSFGGDLGRGSSIFDRRQPTKRCVRTALVIVRPPSLDLGSGFLERQESLRVQASSRRRPSNDPTNALSVGLPGRLKSSVTPFSYAQQPSAFGMNSGPLSTRMVCGAPRDSAIRVIASTTCSR